MAWTAVARGGAGPTLALASVLTLVFALGACAPNAVAPTPPASGEGVAAQRFADVVDGVLTEDADGTFTAAVTISSPYDTPDRYADAWRILAPDGTELAIRELTHDHASEQPFTRSLSAITIPADVRAVRIQARDLRNGWGGSQVEVAVPGR